MNYKKIYDSIIENAKIANRVKGIDEYFERHHIIPKCLGGNDYKDNLVLLTAREHYICHYLLYKIYPHHKGLIHSFWSMSNIYKGAKITSKAYAILKEKHSMLVIESNKRRVVSEETKEKISKSNTGKRLGYKHSEEVKNKIREGNTGKVFTEDTKKKISESLSGENHNFYGKPCSDKRRESIRKARLKTKKVQCPHCEKFFDPCNAKRHHFDNCKSLNKTV